MILFITRFHFIAAISALIFGLWVILSLKGTPLHKVVGYAYLFNMLELNISALFIYRLTGQFGPFHAAALASLLTLVAGFVPAYLRYPRRGWLELHYEFMNWSYVGLVAAALSEGLTRLPASPFWWAVALGSLAVFGVGGALIARGRGKYRFDHPRSGQADANVDIITAWRRRRTTSCN